ncbi:MAG: bifunctional UDP-N-acetylglucosamine diphosphorylase/glucosamine-1-phosphate N-acetyltransferase GlmU [Myxococcota bacterium]
MAKSTAAIILAAGEGTRMRSALPKVLHPVGELPLVAHVVRLALARRCNPIVVVVSPRGERVRAWLEAAFPKAPLVFAVQQEQLGTGDAVTTGLAAMPKLEGQVLILYGDVPLLTAETLSRLGKAAHSKALAFLSAEVPDPTGYGRVVRERGQVARIVEHKDASTHEKQIREINVGVYLATSELLRRTLKGVGRTNAQGEIYLTDIVAMAAREGGAVGLRVVDLNEVRGVNTRAELAEADAIARARIIAQHQARGVTFLDPHGTFVGANVTLGRDVLVGVGVQLRGHVKVGDGVHIEGPTVIQDSTVAKGALIESFCHLEDAAVGVGARVGPFARLRPGTELDAEVRVGNFVEVKKSRLRKGAKANHLAYLGDADIGVASNIGAGTITCNYDGGPVKHRTVIGAEAFVGSNSTLVAPLRIGARSYVAAGSTMTKDVPPNALAFGRARQSNREGYAEKLRARKRPSPEKGR